MLAIDQGREPFIATEAETMIAREAVARLRHIAGAKQDVRLRVMESPEVVVPVPARVLEMLTQVFDAMAEGKPVSFISHEAELTTQQAANFMNVSRTHLIGLLDEGKIPHRLVGTHRRVRMADLAAYREQSQRDREEAIGRIAAEAQRLNLD